MVEGVGYMTNITHDTRTEIEDKAVLVSLVTDAVKRSGINPEHSRRSWFSLLKPLEWRCWMSLRRIAKFRIPSGLLAKERSKSAWQLMAWRNNGHIRSGIVRSTSSEFGRDTRCKIIDRTQLILDIFAQRAKTREGLSRWS